MYKPLPRILVVALTILLLLTVTCFAGAKPFGTDVTEQFFIDKYFTNKKLDPIEGMWTSNAKGTQVDMAIIRNDTDKYKEYDFIGIVVRTNDPMIWGKGQVKLLITKTGNPNYYRADWLISNVLWEEKYGSSIRIFETDNFSSTLPDQFGWLIRITAFKTYPGAQSARPEGPKGGSGTGFFIAPNIVVTNSHVVHFADSIYVTYAGQYRKPAQKLAIDKENDVAILKVEGLEDIIRPLPMANSRETKLGEKVYTLGFPGPSMQGHNAKFTEGSISSLTGFEDNPRYFQMSVPIQPGNSGGPLIDARGRIVGITSAIAAVANYYRNSGALPQNVNYSVKSNYIYSLLNGLPVEVKLQPDPQAGELTPTQIAELAEKAVVFIEARKTE